MEYGEEHPAWDDNLEILLAREWRRLDPAREQTWEHDREAIRYGWANLRVRRLKEMWNQKAEVHFTTG